MCSYVSQNNSAWNSTTDLESTVLFVWLTIFLRYKSLVLAELPTSFSWEEHSHQIIPINVVYSCNLNRFPLFILTSPTRPVNFFIYPPAMAFHSCTQHIMHNTKQHKSAYFQVVKWCDRHDKSAENYQKFYIDAKSNVIIKFVAITVLWWAYSIRYVSCRYQNHAFCIAYWLVFICYTWLLSYTWNVRDYQLIHSHFCSANKISFTEPPEECSERKD